jgi:hypothetical protein
MRDQRCVMKTRTPTPATGLWKLEQEIFQVRVRISKLLWSPGIDSASLCRLAGRYDKKGCCTGPLGWEPIPRLLKRFTNTGQNLNVFNSLATTSLRHCFIVLHSRGLLQGVISFPTRLFLKILILPFFHL